MTMKKGRTAPKTKAQPSAVEYGANKRAGQPAAASSHACTTSTKPQRPIRELSGEPIREEPAELPRLFIRGPVGGSFRMDLRGLNIEFSDAAFAYGVADESMREIHVHRGDIAIIDPLGSLQPGGLLLLHLSGHDVIRRLARKKGVWFLETADGTASTAEPLQDHMAQGVVLGVIRLFADVKPVRYRGTEANFRPSLERGTAQKKISYCSTPSAKPQKRKGQTRRRSSVLAAEDKSPYRLSEVEEKSPYRA